MKKFMILAMLCISVVLQSNGQEQKQKNKPDEQITVNKKYDENGNLVQYDSTYVHQWSSDSTLNLPFDQHFNIGDDFPDALDNSSIDSMLQQLGIAHNFNVSSFRR